MPSILGIFTSPLAMMLAEKLPTYIVNTVIDFMKASHAEKVCAVALTIRDSVVYTTFLAAAIWFWARAAMVLWRYLWLPLLPFLEETDKSTRAILDMLSYKQRTFLDPKNYWGMAKRPSAIGSLYMALGRHVLLHSVFYYLDIFPTFRGNVAKELLMIIVGATIATVVGAMYAQTFVLANATSVARLHSLVKKLEYLPRRAFGAITGLYRSRTTIPANDRPVVT